MSTDFRAQVEQNTEQPLPKGKDSAGVNIADVEVPYRDYENAHGKPYVVDYFKLGDTWSERIGGFPQEVLHIKEYIDDKISSGEIANSVSAIKDLLKSLEKVTNVSKEERPIVKIETISAYVEFLNKKQNINHNLRKYANT